MKFLNLVPIDANYTFRAMLQTLSRPGMIEALALSDQSQCLPETALMLALIDVETKFSVISSLDDIDAQVWARLLGSASGAPIAELPNAEWVLSFGEPSARDLNSLARGSANEPEAGCRLIVTCDNLEEFASEENLETTEKTANDVAKHQSTTIVLRGPGVNGEITLHVVGLSENFFNTLAQVNNSFPAGVDVWLCDQLGHLAAISRSTEFSVMQVQEIVA